MKQKLFYIGKTLQSIGDSEPSCDCGVFDTEEKAWTWVKSQAEQFALDNFPDEDDEVEVKEDAEDKTIKVYGNYYYTNFYGDVKPTYMNDPDKYTLDKMRELDMKIKQQARQAKSEVYYCPECGEELEQGDYAFDENSGLLLTECCPHCGNMGSPVLDEEQANEKFSC